MSTNRHLRELSHLLRTDICWKGRYFSCGSNTLATEQGSHARRSFRVQVLTRVRFWSRTECFRSRWFNHCRRDTSGFICRLGFPGLIPSWSLKLKLCTRKLAARRRVKDLRFGDLWVNVQNHILAVTRGCRSWSSCNRKEGCE